MLSSTLTSTAEKVKEIILTNAKIMAGIKTGKYRNVQILNPTLYAGSGFGKTTIVEMIANDKDFIKEYSSYFGLNFEKGHIEKLLLQTFLPEEIMGIPRVLSEEKITYWTLPSWFKRLLDVANKEVPILFLDELDKPKKEAVSTILTLLASRELREYKLPEWTIIICAMQNVDYSNVELIEDRTIEALWRRLIFVNIELGDYEVFDTIQNKKVIISKDNPFYNYTTFGVMRTGYGNYRSKNPVVPFISPREIAYYLAFVDAYIRRKPEILEKKDKLPFNQAVELITAEIEKLVQMKLENPGRKGEEINYIREIVKLYLKGEEETTDYEQSPLEMTGFSLDTIMKLAKIASQSPNIEKLDFLAYVIAFNPNVSAFSKSLSYLILTLPEETIKNFFSQGHFFNLLENISRKFKRSYINFIKNYIKISEPDLEKVCNFSNYSQMEDESSKLLIIYPSLLQAYKNANKNKAEIYRREIYKLNLLSLMNVGTAIMLRQIAESKIRTDDFARTYAVIKGIKKLIEKHGLDNFCYSMVNDTNKHIALSQIIKTDYYDKATSLIEEEKIFKTIEEEVIISNVIDLTSLFAIEEKLLPELKDVLDSIRGNKQVADEVVEDIKDIHIWSSLELENMDKIYNKKEFVEDFISYLKGGL